MQLSSSVPSGQSCQPSHTDSSARHSPLPQENSAGLQVSAGQEDGGTRGRGGQGVGTVPAATPLAASRVPCLPLSLLPSLAGRGGADEGLPPASRGLGVATSGELMGIPNPPGYLGEACG